MGLPFRVSPDVLIPRLDTEVLVEKLLSVIRGFEIEKPEILDLCTGSGAIGVTLAHELKDAHVTMTDISQAALKVAAGNAQINDVTARCSFVIGDLFDALRDDAVFDVIVSNPPYIESEVIETIDREVRDHEPRLALDGGADGLDFYRRIAAEAPAHLKENGILALEIGYNQGEAVKSLLDQTGRYQAVTVLKDLNGLDRVVLAGRK